MHVLGGCNSAANLQQELHCARAVQLEAGGALEAAAACFLTGGAPEAAATALARRGTIETAIAAEMIASDAAAAALRRGDAEAADGLTALAERMRAQGAAMPTSQPKYTGDRPAVGAAPLVVVDTPQHASGAANAVSPPVALPAPSIGAQNGAATDGSGGAAKETIPMSRALAVRRRTAEAAAQTDTVAPLGQRQRYTAPQMLSVASVIARGAPPGKGFVAPPKACARMQEMDVLLPDLVPPPDVPPPPLPSENLQSGQVPTAVV